MGIFIETDIIEHMSEEYDNIVDQIEKMSRSGQGKEAKQLIRKLNFSKIPRRYRLQLANLARRNHFPLVSIRILNSIVRSEQSLIVATTEERAEYASSLIRIGAVSEAEVLLSQINVNELPKVLLFKSFAAFTRWDYSSAIGWLQEYVSLLEPQSYEFEIANVNLAAAYIFEGKNQEAKSLLEGLRVRTQKRKFVVLQGNSLHLSALLALNNRQFDLANDFLQQATVLLAQSQNVNDFLVRKWKAVVGLYNCSANSHKAKVQSLAQVRNEAFAMHNWETLRDCDLHQAIVIGDQALFQKVMFGTPYLSYRNHMQELGPKDWKLPEDYILGQANSTDWVLDLESGEDNQGKFNLKPGHILHRTLKLLMEDFYHPKNIGSLFSVLFEGEYFDPNSSPDRLYQIIKRLRQWLVTNNIPIVIRESKGFYSAQLSGDLSLRLFLERKPQAREVIQLAKLRRKIGENSFTAHEACKVLEISRPTFSRLVTWGLEEEEIDKVGQGRATRYRLKSA